MIRKSWRHRNIKESFLAAIKGSWLVVRSERNAKIILTAGLIVIITAAILKVNPLEFLILIVVITVVFLSELFNSIAEVILDMIQPEDDPHVKTLKDIASGAVLIACVCSVVAGIVIFLPKILRLINL